MFTDPCSESILFLPSNWNTLWKPKHFQRNVFFCFCCRFFFVMFVYHHPVHCVVVLRSYEPNKRSAGTHRTVYNCAQRVTSIYATSNIVLRSFRQGVFHIQLHNTVIWNSFIYTNRTHHPVLLSWVLNLYFPVTQSVIHRIHWVNLCVCY